MSKNKPVFVVPDGDRWKVKQAGKTVSEHRLKAPAIKSGVGEAKKDKTELVILTRKGVIESKDSYGKEAKVKDTEH